MTEYCLWMVLYQQNGIITTNSIEPRQRTKGLEASPKRVLSFLGGIIIPTVHSDRP